MKQLHEFDHGVFLVNLLGIIYDKSNGTILIGKRESDPHIPQLSWQFPGGRPRYEEELRDELKRQIKLKTGVEVHVIRKVFARTYPEWTRLLSIYYYCEYAGGEAKASEKFVEVKWVKPTEVKDYFTTSIHPKVMEFLEELEAKK